MRSVLLGVAALAVLLHGANLAYLAGVHGCDARLRCPESGRFSETPDTSSYATVAHFIRKDGLLAAPTSRRTPGLPLLLAGAEAATGSQAAALWLVVLFAGLGAAACASTAGALSGRRGPALAAGLLASAWLSSYAHAPKLMTDASHAFLAAAALAASIAWRRFERAPVAALAALGWLAAQSLRPTLFGIGLLLPLLFFKRGASRRYVAVSGLVCLATALVPWWVLSTNRETLGAATASLVVPGTLACYAVPRVKAERGEGGFRALRGDCIESFRALPVRERIPAQYAAFIAFARAHPFELFASHLREWWRQLRAPLRPGPAERPLYPTWLALGSWFVVGFWLCAAVGVRVLARSAPGVAAFFALVFLLVTLPATISHLVGARLRLPADLLLLPVAVVGAAGAWERVVARVPPTSTADPSGSP